MWSRGQSSPSCRSSELSVASPAAESRWPPQSPWSGTWQCSGWSIQFYVINYDEPSLTEISSSLFKSGSSSLKTEKVVHQMRNGCVNILYLWDCSCKNKCSLCRFSNDSMVAFKPIEANISNDFISFIFNTPGGALWCKSILSSIHAPPLNTRKAYLYLSISRQVVSLNIIAFH